MSARCVMVLGTSSGAGKSWITTALCRAYADMGFKVAPFKAQNMSNNARVVATPDGRMGEIGSAQYFQALAARATPHVDMNPVLLKPEADTRSQVVVSGQVHPELNETPWRERSPMLWPHIRAALQRVRQDNDVVVIEGTGSPAEINLHASDIVNMRVAREAQARCLLVTDIDKGGAFAHLYGTWALLPEDERTLMDGFVLNKFRGDASLLAPAPQELAMLTGVPTVATLPWWGGHGLPDEDGVFVHHAARGLPCLKVAILAWPRISNLDEFQALRNVDGVHITWARSPSDCVGADWLILPGSKDTSADLKWMRTQGLDHAVSAHASRGAPVLGICGGLQMLGEALIDSHSIDGNQPGLGLLPLVTSFERDKTVQLTHTRFAPLHGVWAALSDLNVHGYEIHQGQTQAHTAMLAAGDVAHEVLPGLGWQNTAGNVLGVYLHGLFEDPSVLRALLGPLINAPVRDLDSVFDGLAAHWLMHSDPGLLQQLIQHR